MKIFRIPYKLIIANVFFIIWSCNSQEENKVDIKGNWQIVSNSSLEEILYLEVYFDYENVTTYDEKVGLTPRNKYLIKKNNLILISSADGEEKNVGEIAMIDDLLIVTKGKHKLVYKKINKTPSLGDLKTDKIKQEDFAKAFFKRLVKWDQLSEE